MVWVWSIHGGTLPDYLTITAHSTAPCGLISLNFLVTSALFFQTAVNGEVNMQPEIHPRYEEVTARCSCGNEIKTRSTLCEDITIDVCSQCHPFFTGKQKIVDSGGRVDRCKKRFSGRTLRK